MAPSGIEHPTFLACGALPEPNAALRTPTSAQEHVGMLITQLRQLVFGFVDYVVTSHAFTTKVISDTM